MFKLKNMKKLVIIICIGLALVGLSALSCERSEGKKYATLQKVSHKKGLCSHYVMEVAYEGGRVMSSSEGSATTNIQEIKINQIAYDSLQAYLGEKVIFDYEDDAFTFCGPNKILTSIKIKK